MALKRKRNSTHNEVDNWNPSKQIQKLDSSITDLPRHIIFDILLKLSANSVFICKWVCKDWNCIISDPQFFKLHSKKTEPCALVRALDSTHVSLLDLDTKLSIRLPNTRKGCNGRIGPVDQKLKIVNSCNGFLCLSKPSCNEPVVVCNPMTGEYINLPAREVREGTRYFVNSGFGFCPRTGRYKVIRMFERNTASRAGGQVSLRTPKTGWINYSSGIEIYTLGTGSWKNIGNSPRYFSKLEFITYLEGCLHWLICVGGSRADFICSFSFDSERLQTFPSPPFEYYTSNRYSLEAVKHNVSLGVLEGCLCICDASKYDSTDIWVMKKYGDRKSWRKLFSIDNQPVQGWPYGLYRPIDYVSNGAVLMFHLKRALICFDPETPALKYLKVHGVKSKFEAIAYAPSFVSLKEAIVGDNVDVLNISSRYSICFFAFYSFFNPSTHLVPNDDGFKSLITIKWMLRGVSGLM